MAGRRGGAGPIIYHVQPFLTKHVPRSQMSRFGTGTPSAGRQLGKWPIMPSNTMPLRSSTLWSCLNPLNISKDALVDEGETKHGVNSICWKSTEVTHTPVWQSLPEKPYAVCLIFLPWRGQPFPQRSVRRPVSRIGMPDLRFLTSKKESRTILLWPVGEMVNMC